MAKKKLKDLEVQSQDPKGDILKRLTRVQSWTGNRIGRIFEDWLLIVEASLEAMPRHLASAIENGTMAEDTPEAQALFARMRSSYPRPECWQAFQEAFAILLELPESFQAREPGPDVQGYDVLGALYMETSYNPGTGQYFTPWNVALLMAQMVGNAEQDVMNRLAAAGRAVLADPDDVHSLPLHAMTIGAMVLDAGIETGDIEPDTRFRYLAENILPHVLHRYTPVTVCDPCVGSGIMLLAAAFASPAWMVQAGLIQFYGMDIDPTCVRMARCNVMLYDLNGSYVKSALAMSKAEIAALPETYADAITEAQEAQEADRPDIVIEVTAALRAQQALFDLDAFRADVDERGGNWRKPSRSTATPVPVWEVEDQPALLEV